MLMLEPTQYEMLAGWCPSATGPVVNKGSVRSLGPAGSLADIIGILRVPCLPSAHLHCSIACQIEVQASRHGGHTNSSLAVTPPCLRPLQKHSTAHPWHRYSLIGSARYAVMSPICS